jgi:hypothetical protein
MSSHRNWFEKRTDNGLRVSLVGCTLLFAAWAFFILPWLVLVFYYPRHNWIMVAVGLIPLPVIVRGLIDGVREMKRRKIKL